MANKANKPQTKEHNKRSINFFAALTVLVASLSGCNTAEYEEMYSKAVNSYIEDPAKPPTEIPYGNTNVPSGSASGGLKLPAGLDRNGLAQRFEGSWVMTTEFTMADNSVDRMIYRYTFTFAPDKYKHGTFKYYAHDPDKPGNVQPLHEGGWSVLPDSVREERAGYRARLEVVSSQSGPSADLFNDQSPYDLSEITTDGFLRANPYDSDDPSVFTRDPNDQNAGR